MDRQPPVAGIVENLSRGAYHTALYGRGQFLDCPEGRFFACHEPDAVHGSLLSPGN
jgi:hypothetical protein